MRKAILVSPHFPPSSLAGVHRVRHMAKHLPAHGWDPTVVRVDERYYGEPDDDALAALVPAAVRQVRVKALPKALTRPIGFGDIGLRALPYLGAALDKVIASEKPEVVFITGFPFYPMTLAARLKRRHGVAVVLDFQDPWVSAYGASRPPLSHEGLAHQLAAWLEPGCVRQADWITSVSETQNDEMAARYDWLDRGRMSAIPIGGDPQDFDALRNLQPKGQVTLEPDRINLSYVGAFLPRAEPLARRLFRSLAELRARSPELANRLRLNFVGSSNQPAGDGRLRVMPIAEQEGVADLVRETPQRVVFLEALSLLANSNGLLLIGSDEQHYTASKIYPALMSGRPFLSLFHAASSAHAILTAAGGGCSLCFANASELEALGPALAKGLQVLASQPESLGKAKASAYADYTAHAVAGRFADVFGRVT